MSCPVGRRGAESAVRTGFNPNPNHATLHLPELNETMLVFRAARSSSALHSRAAALCAQCSGRTRVRKALIDHSGRRSQVAGRGAEVRATKTKAPGGRRNRIARAPRDVRVGHRAPRTGQRSARRGSPSPLLSSPLFGTRSSQCAIQGIFCSGEARGKRRGSYLAEAHVWRPARAACFFGHALALVHALAQLLVDRAG